MLYVSRATVANGHGRGSVQGDPSNKEVKMSDVLSMFSDLLPDNAETLEKLLQDMLTCPAIADAQLPLDSGGYSRFLKEFTRNQQTSDPLLGVDLSKEDAARRQSGLNIITDKSRRIATGFIGNTNLIDPEVTGKESDSGGVTSSHTDLSLCEDPAGPKPFFPPDLRFDKNGKEVKRGLRERVFTLFDDGSQSTMGTCIEYIIMGTIVISTITFICESLAVFRERPQECFDLKVAGKPLTIEACEPKPLAAFWYVEAVCIAIFTMEYLGKVAFVHAVPDGPHPVIQTLLYMKKPMNIVDFLAILPFYLEVALSGANFGWMSVLRLMRVLRLFKLAKHHPGLIMFAEVMLMSGQPLMLLIFFDCVLTILFAALMYYAEGKSYSVAGDFLGEFPTGVYVRDDSSGADLELTPFRSIPYAAWWVCVTTTTVGYGDYAPTTLPGKVIGVATFYVGIIFLALPISVLGSNFEIVYEKMLASKSTEKKIVVDFRATTRGGEEGGEKAGPATSKRRGSRKVVLGGSASLRKRLFVFLDNPTSSSWANKFSMIMVGVILMSTTTFVLETMPSQQHTPATCNPLAPTVQDCEPQAAPIFGILEVISIAIFSVDYVLRVATAHTAFPEEAGIETAEESPSALKMTLLYIVLPMNVVDFVAILPFYVEQLLGAGGGASVLRVLRLFRIFRIMKMPKMQACTQMFTQVIIDSVPALLILVFMTSLFSIFLGSCLYFCESSSYSVTHPAALEIDPYGAYIRPTHDGYGIEGTPFVDITYSFWWFFTTATTVGYGDLYPTTTFGRLIGIATFYTGIILLALPVTVVGQAFNKYYPDFVEEFSGSSEVDNKLSDSEGEEKKDANFCGCCPCIGGGDGAERASSPPAKKVPMESE
eukprot:TRINITY_DN19953_c1_g1_i1.p1 TRINITY_DN19953_c1_g1~~TRINITY_DN19953_c1_g1_i1.p1  ORF type:complete len:879 (+),score=155.89 TRINITY_DN19953_c1_g1_i1:159-2795(+)